MQCDGRHGRSCASASGTVRALMRFSTASSTPPDVHPAAVSLAGAQKDVNPVEALAPCQRQEWRGTSICALSHRTDTPKRGRTALNVGKFVKLTLATVSLGLGRGLGIPGMLVSPEPLAGPKGQRTPPAPTSEMGEMGPGLFLLVCLVRDMFVTRRHPRPCPTVATPHFSRVAPTSASIDRCLAAEVGVVAGVGENVDVSSFGSRDRQARRVSTAQVQCVHELHADHFGREFDPTRNQSAAREKGWPSERQARYAK